MRGMRKRLFIAVVAGLLVQASVSTARAGSSDLVWIVPVAIAGAALVTVVVIGAVRSSEEKQWPGGRPRRGGLRPEVNSGSYGRSESAIEWDFRHCPQQDVPALFCW